MQELVLLVDDDAILLQLLEITFSGAGFRTSMATNGEEALRALESESPDLIVTDVMMPVMDGFEFCQQVRSDGRWLAIPFIFLSGRSAADDRIAGLDVGADDYVVKPFDRRELLAKAKTLLNRARIYRSQLDGHRAASPPEAVSPGVGAAPGTPTLERSSPSVLVVDDDEPMRKLVEFRLKKARFDVRAARNGVEALAEVERRPPDLIISDVLMPEMDGRELRRSLLDRREYSLIPFLFLTARGETEDMMEGLRLSVDDYLTKPIDPEVLIQKARNLIDRHRSNADHYRGEVELAAKKVSTHLEPDAPNIPGMSIAHFCAPLEVRGGDYYDYITIDGGRYVVVVGDVMGKKWGAWFFSVAYVAYTRSVIRGTSAAGGSPGAIVHAVNQLLWEDLKVSEVFTTLIVTIVDPAARTLTWSSAGHPSPLHLTRGGAGVDEGPHGGPILGLQPDQDYPESSITLEPGDAALFYTDGITEARDAHGEMFGSDRIQEAMLRSESTDARGLVDDVCASAREFVGDAPFEDDRTVVVVRADSER